MKNIVRLNENDLNRLVRKIIKENSGVEVKYDNSGRAIIKNGTRDDVSKFLSNIPEDRDMITIYHCEYADFSEVNLCEFKNLELLSLQDTPNNFEEKTPSECWEKDDSIARYSSNSKLLYSFVKPRTSKQINYGKILNMIKSHGETTIKWDEDKQMFMVPIGDYDYYFK